MAAGIGLNAGLRAILASRYALDTIGHNIANATTPGYSRQSVDLGAARPLLAGGLLIGNGVDATSVRRTVDNLLQRRLLTQNSVQGRLQSRLTTLSELEALLQEPDGTSLGTSIDDFFTSASGLSTDPSDSILRTGMVNSAAQLTGKFHQLAGSLSSIRKDTTREITVRVKEVNDLARQISSMNREISSAQAAGLAPNDLSDKRDLAISNLSELVEVDVKEDKNGAVRILVNGATLVSPTQVHPLTSKIATDGTVELRLDGAAVTTEPKGGVLGGLVALAKTTIPTLSGQLDLLAQNLIREINRAHSTGIPAGGPYESLTGGSSFVDTDKDGDMRDELLSNAGLPADVLSGGLFVNVTDEATGEVEKSRIAISKTHTTVGDLVDALSAVPNLSASIDSLGRLQIQADTGFGFDFSRRLDPNPDPIGALGGGAASLGTAGSEPFALAQGDTLDLSVGANAFSITFDSSDFAQIAEGTAEEVAAVINADAGAIANGLRATAVDGRVELQTLSTGSAASFDLTGGSALGAFGWTALAGSTITGHDTSVGVAISGQYTGPNNDVYTFRPSADGTVGTTPGLTVDVLDSSGTLVATLDVGDTYVPGTELEVAHGVKVSFGLGELSATHNDAMSLDVVNDSDTADVLVATGVGSFFTGSGAADIEVLDEIQLDPDRIATSLTGSVGDNGALLDMLDVEGLSVDQLGNASVGEFYGEIVGQTGFETASTVDSLDANDALIQSLQQRQDSISGVNVDEELVNLVEFEQSFQAASRYINVLNDLNDDLMSLL